jgi:plasmid maintenance system antidote protein VapI/FtsZ-binding cell division protein ZapB
MEKPVKQRIKKVLSSKRVSITALCKAIGVPQPTLNRQINTDAPMTLTNILLILDYFSDVSVTWLLTGEGAMLKNESSNPEITIAPTLNKQTSISQQENVVPYILYEKLQEKLCEQATTIGKLQNELDNLKKQQQESPTTNSDSHAETVQKKRSSSRISGSSAQPDTPTIK